MIHGPRVAVAAGLVAFTIGCGGSAPTQPPAPATPSAPSAPGNATSLAGTWTGTGADPQGPEKMTWSLTQSGDAISGKADLAPMNAADGSCASCHKLKSGTLTGTISGATIAMRIVFPAGGDGVPTPECTITFQAAGSAVASDRIDATYTGDDTCEGPIVGGTFTMRR